MSQAPLVEVVSGSWKGRRIASPPDATELRIPSSDIDVLNGVLIGRPGTDVYHRRLGKWELFTRTATAPTGFVVFAYPPARPQ